MKYNGIFILLLALHLNSCGKDDEKKETTNPVNKNINYAKEESLAARTTSLTDTINNESALSNVFLAELKKGKSKILAIDFIKEQFNFSSENKKVSPSPKESFYLPLRRFLEISKIGIPISKKELEEQYNIPNEGLKLIKSVTKTAENKLFIKWNTNWFVEKFSDARLKDDTVKVHFHDDKLYISGNAIGIKYNKKVYTTLILKGSAAYIPGVKGFHWQIGK